MCLEDSDRSFSDSWVTVLFMDWGPGRLYTGVIGCVQTNDSRKAIPNDNHPIQETPDSLWIIGRHLLSVNTTHRMPAEVAAAVGTTRTTSMSCKRSARRGHSGRKPAPRWKGPPTLRRETGRTLKGSFCLDDNGHRLPFSHSLFRAIL